jgi:hypothetical protein
MATIQQAQGHGEVLSQPEAEHWFDGQRLMLAARHPDKRSHLAPTDQCRPDEGWSHKHPALLLAPQFQDLESPRDRRFSPPPNLFKGGHKDLTEVLLFTGLYPGKIRLIVYAKS